MRDYKEIFQEAFDDALAEGKTRDEAGEAGDQAIQDWNAAQIDAAYEQWRDLADV